MQLIKNNGGNTGQARLFRLADGWKEVDWDHSIIHLLIKPNRLVSKLVFQDVTI